MKKIVLSCALIGALASCTPTEQGTAIGAGTGAISAAPSPTAGVAQQSAQSPAV